MADARLCTAEGYRDIARFVSSTAPLSRSLQAALASLVLSICLAWVAWPLLEHELLGGRTVDGLGSWWFQWWVDARLSQGAGLGHAPELFHPHGKDILGDTGANLVDPLLALPLRRLLGASAAWNLLTLGILATNGLVLAGWAWKRGGLLAGLSALALGCLHPYPLYELSQGRPTQALLAPLLLALALGDRAFESGPRQRGLLLAVGAGVALALAGYTYWFGALFGALALTLLALGRARQAWLPLVVVGAVTAGLSAPLILPLLMRLSEGAEGGVLPVASWWTGLDLHTATGDTVPLCTLAGLGQAGFLTEGGWTPTAAVLGLGTGLLALASGLKERRWWLIFGLALALAVGPRPLGLPNPVYLGLASVLPGMDRLYWPCRAMALTLALVAPACAALSRRGPIWLTLPLVAVLVGLPLRGALPLASWDATVPRAVSCLAEAQGAVIDLPFARDHEPLLYQTVHGRPLLDGMNPRSGSQVPREARALVEDNGWIQALVVAGGNPRSRLTWTAEDLQQAQELGFRWVLVRLEPLRSDKPEVDRMRLRSLRGRLEQLAGPPRLEDDDAWLFAPFGDPLPCRDSLSP
jgi:hypothetical protein